MPVVRGGVRRRYVNGVKHSLTMSQAWLRSRGGAQERGLPGIVVIGVQRGGTTSLFRYLAAHHRIVEPLSKELNYFSLHYQLGLSWYRGNFPRLQPGQVTMEASPTYLLDPRVPARVARDLPEAHFVAMLRNPTERAYSQYLHNLEHGLESLSFVDALDAEEERLREGWRLGLETRRGYALVRNAGYVLRGRYVDQLERWLEHVPRERLHVLRSEDLFGEPETTLNTLLDGLGLPHDPDITFRRTNHWDDDADTQLTPQVRRRLDEAFAPSNARLASLVGWADTWTPSATR